MLAGLVSGLAGGLLALVWRFPAVAALAAAVLGLWVTVGPVPALALAGLLVAALLWRLGKMAAGMFGGAGGDVVVLVLLGVGHLLWWLARHPLTTLATAGALTAGLYAGVLGVGVWVVFVAAGCWAWATLWPASWRRWMGPRFWTLLREPVYRVRWRRVMLVGRLGGVLDGDELLPRLIRFRALSRYQDWMVIALPEGQTLDDWVKRGNLLATSFKSRSCTVAQAMDWRGRERPGYLTLTFVRGDPLVAPRVADVDAIDLETDDVDLRAVRIGLTELGGPATFPLLGGHGLLAGATESGKSSTGWAILAGTAPAIVSTRAAWWAIDPKGNELAIGRPLFAEYARPQFSDDSDEIGEATAAPMVNLVVKAATLALQRGEQLAARGLREHVPEPGSPAIFLWIDELVWFAKLCPPESKKKFFSALAVIFSQGRSAGVYVVLSTQDLRKEILPDRHFVARRALHRCAEQDEVDWALGKGARDRGARADEIPEAHPGVGYLSVDGTNDVVRFRADFWDNNAIRRLAELARPRPVVLADNVVEVHAWDTDEPGHGPIDDYDDDPFGDPFDRPGVAA